MRYHAHRDGQLSSAPVWPAVHRGLFRRPASRAQLEDAGDGARRAQRSTRSPLAARQRLSPQAEAAGGNRAGRTTRSPAAPIPTPCPATPAIAPCSPRPSRAACSLPAKPPPRTFSPPLTARATAAREPRGKFLRRSRRNQYCVLSSLPGSTRQSILKKQIGTGDNAERKIRWEFPRRAPLIAIGAMLLMSAFIKSTA